MQVPIKSGIINLNKPSGMTSRGAVDAVTRCAGKIKIGHAGTLDPLARGVLVLCLGQATRLIEYVQRMPKRYTGEFLLGRRSSTEDVEGEIVELPDPPVPTLAEIENAAAGFLGTIEQRPPAFSALKVNGRRAYDLARAGKPPVLKARPVRIYSLKIVAYEYPQLTLDIECGSGTYIRSLGRDLAETLGTAAVMSGLNRTGVGRFTLDEAADLADLSKETLPSRILPPITAVGALPRIELSDDEMAEIGHGRAIRRHNRLPAGEPLPKEYAAISPQGRLAAILIHRDRDHLRALRNFPQ